MQGRYSHPFVDVVEHAKHIAQRARLQIVIKETTTVITHVGALMTKSCAYGRKCRASDAHQSPVGIRSAVRYGEIFNQSVAILIHDSTLQAQLAAVKETTFQQNRADFTDSVDTSSLAASTCDLSAKTTS